MNIQLIGNKEAYRRAREVKDLAYSIAAAHNTLPANCTAPECVLYCDLLTVASLIEHEKCILIDGKVQNVLTSFEISPGQNAIGKLCCENVVSVDMPDETSMNLNYADGVIEYYVFNTDMQCWVYVCNNVGDKYANRSIN